MFSRCIVRSSRHWQSSVARRCFSSPVKTVTALHKPAGLDLSRVYVGQVLENIDEITVSRGWPELWQTSFYEPDRLHTSRNFAMSLGFRDQLLPFTFLLNKTVGMSHLETSRVVLDLGFKNAVYVSAAYGGQTFKKQFSIKSLAPTSNGEDVVVTFKCDLLNDNGKNVVFTVDKTMLFKGVSRSNADALKDGAMPSSLLLDHLKQHAASLPSLPTLTDLSSSNKLLLHSMQRAIPKSSSMGLSSLFRMTHPMIFNVAKYGEENLVTPGGLVVSAAFACSARDLFEVIYQEIRSCAFINKVCPMDTIGAMTFVESVQPISSNLEEVFVTTIGVKNVELLQLLDGKQLPESLFTSELRPNQVEEMCREHVPELAGKIAVIAQRRLVRQSPFAQDSQIPLL